MSHKPPLWKQIIGAGIGALMAVALYGGYTIFSPHLSEGIQGLQAYLLSDFAGKTTVPDSPRPSRRFIRELAEEQNSVHRGITNHARQLARQSVLGQVTEDPLSGLERVTDPKPEKEGQLGTVRESEKDTESKTEPFQKMDDEYALPDSGIALWLGIVGAVGAGGLIHYKRLLKLMCMAKTSREEKRAPSVHL